MEVFERSITLRWSDMDINGHARHSVYYDFGAQNRIEFLFEHGLTLPVMMEHNFGPILFREECVFRRELRHGDDLRINLMISKMKKDVSRWTIVHHILRGDDLCAVLTVDGAWIDTIKRKLAVPPQIVVDTFYDMPRTEDFFWLDEQ